MEKKMVETLDVKMDEAAKWDMQMKVFNRMKWIVEDRNACV